MEYKDWRENLREKEIEVGVAFLASVPEPPPPSYLASFLCDLEGEAEYRRGVKRQYYYPAEMDVRCLTYLAHSKRLSKAGLVKSLREIMDTWASPLITIAANDLLTSEEYSFLTTPYLCRRVLEEHPEIVEDCVRNPRAVNALVKKVVGESGYLSLEKHIWEYLSLLYISGGFAEIEK